jgi:hypothetical protein
LNNPLDARTPDNRIKAKAPVEASTRAFHFSFHGRSTRAKAAAISNNGQCHGYREFCFYPQGHPRMGAPMSVAGPIFIVRLRGNGLNDIRELRRFLKILLRRFGLRCVGISQEQAPQ